MRRVVGSMKWINDNECLCTTEESDLHSIGERTKPVVSS